MAHFLVINLNPTLQRTVLLPALVHGEVNRAQSVRIDAAGKGLHAARVLRQLGGEACLLTHLGPGKELFLELCAQEGIGPGWVKSHSPLRTCITLLDEATGAATEIIEPTEAVASDTVSAFHALLEQELPKAKWLILTGSRAAGYPDDFFVQICRMALALGIHVVADFHGKELMECVKLGLRVLKINLVEFAQTFLPRLNVSEADDAQALEAVECAMAELSHSGCDCVVTRGKRPVLYAHAGSSGRHTPPAVMQVNPIGSGDAFCAGLTFSLAGGLALPEAVAEGARCGSLNAGFLQPGTIGAALKTPFSS
ncbi:MAG: hypothetical protein B0D92_06785 [Spirochaeta sp. LUC14_002_19_P3]|nr:MAG: hypothetical protein B0D92_06785 [Spirochaeta sp. LUC14_002_19_P3]